MIHSRYCGDGKNLIMLGNTRIRQLRVAKNRGCEVHAAFSHFTTRTPKGGTEKLACYSPFTVEHQSTIPFDPRHTPKNVVQFFSHSQFRSSEPGKSTQFRNDAGMTPMHGVHSGPEGYPGEGYYWDLPLKKQDALDVVTELRNWNWIDKKTRAIIIENSVVNPNTNIIVSNRLLFEFNAFGGVRIIRDHFPMRASLLALNLIATDETSFFMFVVVFSACFLLYFLMTLWFIYKNGKQ